VRHPDRASARAGELCEANRIATLLFKRCADDFRAAGPQIIADA
jgi:hypothetical protein